MMIDDTKIQNHTFCGEWLTLSGGLQGIGLAFPLMCRYWERQHVLSSSNHRDQLQQEGL